MRLNCDIVINNRLSSSLGTQVHNKAKRASLMIGNKNKGSTEKVALLITTNLEPLGKCYQIENNVEKTFTNFIGQGKCTIRLSEPPVDLLISGANPEELKRFVNVLKVPSLLNKTEQTQLPPLAALEPPSKKQIQSGKTKLVIKSPKDYPTLTSFPKQLHTLIIQECTLNRIEKRIAKLETLKHLSFENNRIKEIPKELCMLELDSLVLKKNRIKDLPADLFSEGKWKCSLKSLDLSENAIEYLPSDVRMLDFLVNLSVTNNSLKALPDGIGNMKSLKELRCANNKLSTLPGSIVKMKLNFIDISGNEFLPEGKKIIENKLQVPSLFDRASAVVLRNNIPYGPEDLPGQIIHYLTSSKPCQCGNPCFNTYMSFTNWYNLNPIAGTFCVDFTKVLPLKMYFCSSNCVSRYARNPFTPRK